MDVQETNDNDDYKEKYNLLIEKIHCALFDSGTISDLPDKLKDDEALGKIYSALSILREAIFSLSGGELTFNFSLKGFLGGALKMLQANLRHLTWQTQKIAEGDFSQKVDFMGDFSSAFNSMVLKLKENIERIMDQEHKLIELNATKDKFFSIIAHDLRAPIGTFKALTERISSNIDSYSTEDLQEYMVLMKEASVNVFSLLENLLLWYRAQRGVIECNREKVNVKKLADTTLEVLRLNAENKGIELEQDIPPDLYCFADSNMISTVILNLVSNSIKFTYPKGRITISAVKNQESTGNFIKIIISDNGIGMTPDILGKIFRIDVTHSGLGTAGESGTGLGLVLCKEFVEKNGGKISVESEQGKGSSFIFILPEAV